MKALVPFLCTLVCSLGFTGCSESDGGGEVCWPSDNTTGEPIACEGATVNEELLTILSPCVLPDVPACTAARCVPSSLVPDTADPEDLADCSLTNGTGKCVPDSLVTTTGQFLLSSCTAANGEEGRCLSPCVPEVAANAETLEQDICQAGWLCSPCFENGIPTGACEQGCDPGPSNPGSSLCE